MIKMYRKIEGDYVFLLAQNRFIDSFINKITPFITKSTWCKYRKNVYKMILIVYFFKKYKINFILKL